MLCASVEQKSEIAALKERVQSLEGLLSGSAGAGGTGRQYASIVGYVGGDASHPCPKGWRSFAEANGRTLIGAGYYPPSDAARAGRDSHFPALNENPDSFKTAMRTAAVRDGLPGDHLTIGTSKGGRETTIIGAENVPELKIKVQNLKVAAGNGTEFGLGAAGGNPQRPDTEVALVNVRKSSGSGEPAPMTNLPPYVAVYFCQPDRK